MWSWPAAWCCRRPPRRARSPAGGRDSLALLAGGNRLHQLARVLAARHCALLWRLGVALLIKQGRHARHLLVGKLLDLARRRGALLRRPRRRRRRRGPWRSPLCRRLRLALGLYLRSWDGGAAARGRRSAVKGGSAANPALPQSAALVVVARWPATARTARAHLRGLLQDLVLGRVLLPAALHQQLQPPLPLLLVLRVVRVAHLRGAVAGRAAGWGRRPTGRQASRPAHSKRPPAHPPHAPTPPSPQRTSVLLATDSGPPSRPTSSWRATE